MRFSQDCLHRSQKTVCVTRGMRSPSPVGHYLPTRFKVRVITCKRRGPTQLRLGCLRRVARRVAMWRKRGNKIERRTWRNFLAPAAVDANVRSSPGGAKKSRGNFSATIRGRHLEGFGASRGGPGSERVDARREPRQLARHGILVHHALGRGPVQFGLSDAGTPTAPHPCRRSSIAVSTFLTKVRTRLSRARLIAVRFSVWRSRFSADL